MTGKLIIVCGVDGSGKTTLIEGLRRLGIPDYIFNYSYPKMWSIDTNGAFAMGEYIASLRIFQQLIIRDKVIVTDRFHLGEYVYGIVMRHYPKWFAEKIVEDVEDYMLNDDLILKFPIYIIILHSSPSTILKRKGSLKGEYPTTEEELYDIDKYYTIVPTRIKCLHITTDSLKYNNHQDLVLKEVVKWLSG